MLGNNLRRVFGYLGLLTVDKLRRVISKVFDKLLVVQVPSPISVSRQLVALTTQARIHGGECQRLCGHCPESSIQTSPVATRQGSASFVSLARLAPPTEVKL